MTRNTTNCFKNVQLILELSLNAIEYMERYMYVIAALAVLHSTTK